MSAAHTPGPWSIGRAGRPSTLAIFRETATARELVARFADHTVSYADVAFIVRACNAHEELLAALRLFLSGA